jgi:beta-lactamase regulating signal transducer with metallopeptidase domain
MIASPLVNILIQSAVIFCLVFAITRSFPAIYPRVQSILWLLFFGHLIVAPFYSVPLQLVSRKINNAPSPANATGDSVIVFLAHVSTPASPTLPLPYILWVSGTVILLLIGLIQYRSTIVQLRNYQYAPNEIQAEAEIIAQQLGLKRTVCVKTVESGMPCSIGFINALILIPSNLLLDSKKEERDAILIHEMAHIRHCDSQWSLLLAGVRAIYFFHPLTWIAYQEWSTLREMMCDDTVLDRKKIAPMRYCEILFAICQAELPRPATTRAFSTGFLQLQRRIKHMKTQKNKGAVSVAAIAALLVVGTLSIPAHLAWTNATTSPGQTQVPLLGDSKIHQTVPIIRDVPPIVAAKVSDIVPRLSATDLLDTKVTIKLEDARLLDVTRGLSRDIGIIIKVEADQNITVSVDEQETTFRVVLDLMCKDTNLKWKQTEDGTIIIYKE